MENDELKIIKKLNFDTRFLINESFLGYKYRKKTGNLYNSDLSIPKNLIRLYFGLGCGSDLDILKKEFINRYIRNESKLEDIDDSDIHGQLEKEGLGVMYEYIHSDEINLGGIPPFSFARREQREKQIGRFNIWTLQNLQMKLFSFAPHAEEAGKFKSYDVYLPNSGSNLCPWDMVIDSLWELSPIVDQLEQEAKELKAYRDNGNPSIYLKKLFEYIEESVKLNCELIKIYPFPDGNGRTIRGFTNKLFEDAGLPPVYIKPNERTEYHKAMSSANNDGNYSEIIGFYHYKICDSIIELDINERVKEQREENKKKNS